MLPLKVAIIGLGTVGTGVAHILLEASARCNLRAGREIEICRVVVKEIDKPRDITLPAGLLTDDIQTVIDDPDIDVAIQLIGGLDPAEQVMSDLLTSGKDIVTANKALLCERGERLFKLAKNQGRTISFEAAVAGGIPIVSTLGQSMTANEIISIEAILNGTSNFILTEMLKRNSPYQDVLKEAQELGYAEANPAMDVDGTDAVQKLVILTQLAFGVNVSPDAFPRQGIDTLELSDLRYAAQLGYTVKLLAVSRLSEGELEMHVQPTLVRHERPIAQVEGAYNMIAIEGDAVGKTWYSGLGAGQMPTASAVVADLIDVATGRAAISFSHLSLWNEQSSILVQPAEDIERRYYLRFNVEDRPHVFADIANILGNNQISLASINQPEAPELATTTEAPPAIAVVVMTHRTTEGQLRKATAELEYLSSLHPPLVCMPVAD